MQLPEPSDAVIPVVRQLQPLDSAAGEGSASEADAHGFSVLALQQGVPETKWILLAQ